jgi:hypothetical protein
LGQLPVLPTVKPLVGRTLIRQGIVLAPTFFESDPVDSEIDAAALAPRSPGQYATAHASGDRWYAPTETTVDSLLEGESGKLVRRTVWDGGAIRGFDAAGGSVAVVTETRALWCAPESGKQDLRCDTVITDDLPGPVALSPDGNTLWLAVEHGEVRRWRGPSAATSFTQARGIPGAVGELTLLRAYDSQVYVAAATGRRPIPLVESQA